MHTLLLALSAWGRGFVVEHDAATPSLEFSQLAQFADAEFHFTLSALRSRSIDTQSICYPALHAEMLLLHNSENSENEEIASVQAYIKVTDVFLRQPTLQDVVTSSIFVYQGIWAREGLRSRDFLGAPAKDFLVRQHLSIGTSTTKIRKIFTVRNAKDGYNVFILSFSAPPDDYDSDESDFDIA